MVQLTDQGRSLSIGFLVATRLSTDATMHDVSPLRRHCEDHPSIVEHLDAHNTNIK